MQAVLRYACERPIRGLAMDVHHIRGEVVQTDERRLRVVARGSANTFHMCDPCGAWVPQATEGSAA